MTVRRDRRSGASRCAVLAGVDELLGNGFTATGDGDRGTIRLREATVGGVFDVIGAVVESISSPLHRWMIDGLTYSGGAAVGGAGQPPRGAGGAARCHPVVLCGAALSAARGGVSSRWPRYGRPYGVDAAAAGSTPAGGIDWLAGPVVDQADWSLARLRLPAVTGAGHFNPVMSYRGGYRTGCAHRTPQWAHVGSRCRPRTLRPGDGPVGGGTGRVRGCARRG